MKQIVFKNSFYISGKYPEVLKYLSDLSKKFPTVKSLLDYYNKKL